MGLFCWDNCVSINDISEKTITVSIIIETGALSNK
jgi:hypothetical protein